MIWHTVITGYSSHQYENKDTIFQIEGFMMMLLELKKYFGVDKNVQYSEPVQLLWLYQVFQGFCGYVLWVFQKNVCCYHCWRQYQPSLWWLGLRQVKVDYGKIQWRYNHQCYHIVLRMKSVVVLKNSVWRWLWSVALAMFAETANPPSHDNFLTIM